jgi:hypothetical protein
MEPDGSLLRTKERILGQLNIVYIRYTYWYCHVYEWQVTGFGLVIGFIEP